MKKNIFICICLFTTFLVFLLILLKIRNNHVEKEYTPMNFSNILWISANSNYIYFGNDNSFKYYNQDGYVDNYFLCNSYKYIDKKISLICDISNDKYEKYNIATSIDVVSNLDNELILSFNDKIEYFRKVDENENR